MNSIDLNELVGQLDLYRSYDHNMIYSWSIGLIGGKKKAAIEIMVKQLEEALLEWHSESEFVHANFYHLLDELKDRAEDPAWRFKTWEN